MESTITLGQFVLGILALLVPQIFTILSNWQKQRADKPLTDAQAKDVLGEAMGEALTQLGQEYSRMLETHRKLEDEVNSLRPLTLKVALAEQELKQSRRDKEDWKRYAEMLREHIEGKGEVPPPFRRMPSNGDSQKMKAIQQAKEQIVQAVTTPTETILETIGRSAIKETPTEADKDR